MSALFVLALMTAGAAGWGGLILKALKVEGAWHLPLAFTLGIGGLGWLYFLPPAAALVGWPFFALLAAAGLPGLWFLRSARMDCQPATPWTWCLWLIGLFIMAVDLAEALAPPSDADSLAYHFAIPAQMLAEGRLVFVPRAADGAIPLLQQMTYLGALVLGGEQALTLWCMVSGWAGPWLAYAVARRWLERDWALGLAIALLCLPAQLYGAGTGQVESRMAAFTLAAALGLVASQAGRDWRGAVLAGLAAGFAMASKYPGLLIVFLCGLALLAQRNGLTKAVAFSLAALAAGSQWYVWNWINTGDPVFPMLYGLVPYRPGVAWDETAQAAFRHWAGAIEAPLSRGLDDLVSYPLMATFRPHPAIDSGRTGLGILPLLLAPFALAGAFVHRRGLAGSPLLIFAGLVLGFTLLWFFFGASQRVRHYLPVMALLLIPMLVAALRCGSVRPVIAAALAATILIQTAGQALFLRPFAQRILAGQSRDDFLVANVPLAFAALAANRDLPAEARLVINQRQWLYLIERPTWFVTPTQQAVVTLRRDELGPARVLEQLRSIGATHALGMIGEMEAFARLGCLKPLTIYEGPAPPASRTLGPSGAETVTVDLAAIDYDCLDRK